MITCKPMSFRPTTEFYMGMQNFVINIKFAQRFVCPLACKAGEGWGEGTGVASSIYRGRHFLAMTVTKLETFFGVNF